MAGPFAPTAPRPFPAWVVRGIRAFAALKHIFSALFFGIKAVIFLTLGPYDVSNIHLYSPLATSCCFGVLSGLHLTALLASVRRCCRSTRSRVSSTAGDELKVHLSTRKRAWPTKETVGIAATALEVACQSFEASHVAASVVDIRFVSMYVGLVGINCVVASWLLLATTAADVKSHRVLACRLFRCVVGVCLSSVLPFLGAILPSLVYVFGNVNISNDGLWETNMVLFARAMVVSSPVDLAAKVGVACATLLSMRRLERAVDQAELALPPRVGASIAPALAKPASGVVAPSRSLGRQRVRGFAMASTAWGFVLVVLLIRSVWFRASCPSICKAQVVPLTDVACHCKFASINCHAMQNESIDVAGAVNAAALGGGLFYLEIRRCDFVHGMSLAEFDDLSYVVVEFTKLQQWRGHLPPALQTFSVRQSHLDAIPDILLANIPSMLSLIVIEAAPVRTLPASIPHLWQNVSVVVLNNVSLVDLPPNLTALRSLRVLSLSYNQLGNLSQPQLVSIRSIPTLQALHFGGNGFTEIPQELVPPNMDDGAFHIVLTSNPIATLPPFVRQSWLVTRLIQIDDTTFCKEHRTSFCAAAPCAHQCEPWRVGDYTCDYQCFNAACEFDRGDCDEFGFD